MESIFDLIEALASNSYIIFIIIAGIIGFIKSSSSKKNEEQQGRPTKTSRPKPAAASNGRKQTVYADDHSDRVYTTSIEEKQNEQMERLANRYRTSANQSVEGLEHSKFDQNILRETVENDLSKQRSYLKKEIGTNLKGKRLINGIIMSEVLGPPRAHKPYRNVISQRKN